MRGIGEGQYKLGVVQLLGLGLWHHIQQLTKWIAKDDIYDQEEYGFDIPEGQNIALIGNLEGTGLNQHQADNIKMSS